MAKLNDRPFWQALERFGDAPALFDDTSEVRISYKELEGYIRRGADRLSSSHKKLVWVAAGKDLGGICSYLSALRAGHAVCLWPENSPHLFDERLMEKYRPDIVLWKDRRASRRIPETLQLEPDLFGYHYGRISGAAPLQNADLALLMPTSGSTGSPKIARLSWRNIEYSADQVVEALQITDSQRAITTLPISFVYGLTVINSHLKAGASIVLTERSVYDHSFWSTVQVKAITTLPAIPWTIQALREINFQREAFPPLRSITISGGSLAQPQADWLTAALHNRGIEVYSMYGQTEACGRIAVLPPSEFGKKPYSVGVAVPGGQIGCDHEGQIVYTGPNVMLGYAADRSELEKGDELRGILHTGDLGYFDGDGSLCVTGRITRISKVWGLRVDLDDLEKQLGTASTAIIEEGGRIHVFVQDHSLATDQLKAELANHISLPRYLFEFNFVDALPRTSSGKIEYEDLRRRVQRS